jgi:gluconate 5-dehydrogenase
MSRFDLSSRIAFVSGSYRGLGLAIAEGLAEHGATVVLNGRNADRVAAAVAKLKQRKLAAAGYAFDVTDEAAVKENIARIEREVGPIDIVVNSAGISPRQPAVDFKTEDYHAVLRTNIDGVFFVSREAARGMIARRRGKVISLGSIAGQMSRPKLAPYSASKGAVHQLTKGLAVEWAPHNIQVNAIAPGVFRTALNQKLLDESERGKELRMRTPMGRFGKTEELVGSAIFLASEASNFVTGEILVVDGGFLASGVNQ